MDRVVLGAATRPLSISQKAIYFSSTGKVYAVEYKTYMCVICGFIYEEEKGLPDEGFAPGTRWEDIPDTWVCPDCDAGKEDFEMVEI